MTMDLQKKLDDWQKKTREEALEGERMLNHRLASRLKVLSRYRSTAQLRRSKIFLSLKNEIERLIYGYEFGMYAPPAVVKPFYRVVAWDLHHAIRYDGILEVLKTHPILSKADVILLSSVDLGMARSGNRNVARSLAIELEMNYIFAATHLSLASDASAEGQNQVGIEGNAILSRYPFYYPRVVDLPGGQDPMRGVHKRYGSHKAVLVDVAFGDQKVTTACVHLDELTSARQRAEHMKMVLQQVNRRDIPMPAILGGAWNTSTYNVSSTLGLMAGFVNRMTRGIDYILEEHHTYPERHFEAHLFQVLKNAGFRYDVFNEIGKGTFHYSSAELQTSPLLKQVMPIWLTGMMKKILRAHGDKISLKLDWFAANEKILPSAHPHAEKPKVISHLYDKSGPVSAHDPIILDFEIPQP